MASQPLTAISHKNNLGVPRQSALLKKTAREEIYEGCLEERRWPGRRTLKRFFLCAEEPLFPTKNEKIKLGCHEWKRQIGLANRPRN